MQVVIERLDCFQRAMRQPRFELNADSALLMAREEPRLDGAQQLEDGKRQH